VPLRDSNAIDGAANGALKMQDTLVSSEVQRVNALLEAHGDDATDVLSSDSVAMFSLLVPRGGGLRLVPWLE
jgi:hypothetical protein